MQSLGFCWHLFGLGWEYFSFIERASIKAEKYEVHIYPWKAPVLNFEQAMLTGLARDGGLYVPQSIPSFSPDDIISMSDKSYEEIAFKIISPFVGDCFSDDELIKIINKAYTKFGHIERAPLVELENNHFPFGIISWANAGL